MNRIPDERAPYKAFISYAHRDDALGYVSKFRERLQKAVGMLLGEDFPIFQDRPHIVWGENWEERIRRSITEEVVFLIPILSPSFFNSEECRKETTLFLEREKNYGRTDLLLPVYFVNSDVLDDSSKLKKNALAQAISRHQIKDWRNFRTGPYTAQVLRRLEEMAAGLKAALDRKVMAPAGARRRGSGPSASRSSAATTYAPPAKVRSLVDDLLPLLEEALRAREEALRANEKVVRAHGVLPDEAAPARKGHAARPPKAVARVRRAGAKRAGQDAYEQSVFISTPFSKQYRPLYEAIVFTVASLGLRPRSILEELDSAAAPRLEWLMRIIGECRYGIFDLSQTAGVGKEAPRLNTPLELGLFLGARRYDAGRRPERAIFLMDREPYTYVKMASNLAGYDLYAHRNRISAVIQGVRNWLAIASRSSTMPGAENIQRRFLIFKKQLPDIYRAMEVRASEVSHWDFTDLTFAWLGQMEKLNKR